MHFHFPTPSVRVFDIEIIKKYSIKNGTSLNGKPLYKKVGNELLFLAYTNVSNYATPWTMWGGSIDLDRVRLGNIKIGPKGIQCPEHQHVSNS